MMLMMTAARFEQRRLFYWLLTTVYCLLPLNFAPGFAKLSALPGHFQIKGVEVSL